MRRWDKQLQTLYRFLLYHNFLQILGTRVLKQGKCQQGTLRMCRRIPPVGHNPLQHLGIVDLLVRIRHGDNLEMSRCKLLARRNPLMQFDIHNPMLGKFGGMLLRSHHMFDPSHIHQRRCGRRIQRPQPSPMGKLL
jgi:hypothetical protein